MTDISFTVPDSAVRFILLQRTSFRFLRKHIDRLGISYSGYLSHLEAFLRSHAVKKAFHLQILSEYEMLKTHLLPHARSILDIGCGVAGIDATLAKHYGPSSSTKPRRSLSLFNSSPSTRKNLSGSK